MYLEKLEIQGFKSFANKNELAFPSKLKDSKGITVIVGPNGSGKSNIADAVRWALGEQSMKTIRAKSGEDVIFSGSASKGQLGMAEVSLFLNNEDGQAPIDYSQLVITRRIYRNGESDYLLNGAKVRLVDVQILLAKANVGQKTYSVIGQGMVESFLATTATERKEFFDEATGVRQFQIKREQSVNKLIVSYENLGQANMLLTEIEPRLKSLTRQVNKLQQKGEIETQLHEARTIYFQHAWHKLNDKFNEFNNKFLELEARGRQQNAELEALNLELGKMEESQEWQEAEKLTQEINKLQRQREDVIKKIAAVEAQLSLHLEAAGNFDLSWLNQKESELKQEVERAKESLAIIAAEIAQEKSKVNSFSADKKSLAEKTAELNQKLSSLSLDGEKDGDKEKKVSAKLEEAKICLEELEREAELEKIKEYLLRLKTLVREIIELRGSENKGNEIFFAQQKEIQEKLTALAAEREALLEKESEYRLRAKSLEEKSSLLENDFSRRQNELKNIQEKIAQAAKPKEDNSGLLQKKSELEKELQALDEQVKAEKEKLFLFNKEGEEKRARLFKMQKEGQARQIEINRLNNELNSVKIEAAKYETRLEDLEMEIRKVIENLKDIREQRPAGEINEEEFESRIKQLENQLNLIGGIDPGIEKEYGEIKQKYDFLTEQTDDLEAAIGSLEEVIRELDAQIKVRFEKEFKEICKKFEEYFKILFNGGTAKIIRLEEEEKTAEEKEAAGDEAKDELKEKIKRLSKFNATGLAGIEIQACPPGKKISSINMLSGGEKALTAIALICAIISANPSPFVFLDEVDAALDEANSERLARILDDLSHKTQFIVITHNRAPMHRANVLYGVTMQENGVSKLLSIKLEDYIK